ncbi:hypothetical protein KCU79_g3774, partial [Aureobasidium melanogenum]
MAAIPETRFKSKEETTFDRVLASRLARAGFFFKPAPDSDDNVQCFHCAVKLDGWESQDVPLHEHLAHSAHCSYALSLSVSDKAEERDPMSPELLEARTSTFGDMWPHEHKKGWKPKIKQMVEAGWAYDPSPADEDGATCFYCNMSLDGWEPKDSPLEEHRRREPNCPFFALMDRYKSTRRKGGRARASTASRASRLSTQSVQSTFSEAPSLMSLGDTGPQLEEDSIALDTTISDAGKGRKKAPKGKKKTARQESVEPSIQYPTLQEPSQVEEDIYAVPVDSDPVPVVEQPKPKRGRKPKNAQESTLIDDTVAEPAPKPTRGRKKAKEPSPAPETSLDESQLQSELQEAAVVAESTQTKSGRGVKRTSDGLEKHPLAEDDVVDEEPTKPKKAAKSTKAKKSKKVAKDNQEEAEESAAISQSEEKPKRTRSKKTKKIESEPEPEPEPEPEVEPETVIEPVIEEQTELLHPAELEEQLEPEQGAFERNFEIADSDAELDDQAQQELPEQEVDQENVDPIAEADIDMEPENEQPHEQQDEDALDDEFNNLENVEAEEEVVVQTEDNEVDQEEERPASIARTPAAEEFEPTPTPEVKRVSATSVSSVRRSVIQRANSEEVEESAHSTPRSAQQSDAENQPPSSSTHAPATAQKVVPALDAVNSAIQPKEIFASPTKTTRVPLAASTPNHSPSRRSPSKFGRLTSTTPWEAVDLESIFFPDSENENGDADDVFNKLLEVGGALSSPEKKMTVEEWIRSRAESGENKLKNECERMVMLFEKEGNRGLAALNGIQTSS